MQFSRLRWLPSDQLQDGLKIAQPQYRVFQTIGAFNKNDKQLRQFIIIGTLFWLCHNYIAGSPVAELMEILFLSSNITGYYRFYIRSQVKVNV